MANTCHNILEVSGSADEVTAAEPVLRELIQTVENDNPFSPEPDIVRMENEGIFPEEDDPQNTGCIQAWFDTRWVPPVDTFQRFSADHPGLRVHLAFDDVEGGRLCGYIDFEAGKAEREQLYGFSLGRELAEHFPQRHRLPEYIPDGPPF